MELTVAPRVTRARRLATDPAFRREWRELRRLSRLAPYTPGSTSVAGPPVRFTHPQAFVAQYRAMFAAAGLPVEDGVPTDALVAALVVGGDATAVTNRLGQLAEVRDELLVTLPEPAGARPDHEEVLLRAIGDLTRAFAG